MQHRDLLVLTGGFSLAIALGWLARADREGVVKGQAAENGVFKCARLEIVDEAGHSRILLGRLEPNRFGMTIQDKAGREQIVIACPDGDGKADGKTEITIFDALGTAVVRIQCDDDVHHGPYPSIELSVGPEAPLLVLEKDHGFANPGARLAMFGPSGDEVIGLSAGIRGVAPEMIMRSLSFEAETAPKPATSEAPTLPGILRLAAPCFHSPESLDSVPLVLTALGKSIELRFERQADPRLTIHGKGDSPVFSTGK